MRLRRSARILVLDPDCRVLLFRFVFREGSLAGTEFWAAPGGELDAGETFEAAAHRELLEETGLTTDNLGNCIAEREYTMTLPTGEEVKAQERFYLMMVKDTTLSFERQTEEERQVMTEHKWWTVEELAISPARIYPTDLSLIVESIRGISA